MRLHPIRRVQVLTVLVGAFLAAVPAGPLSAVDAAASTRPATARLSTPTFTQSWTQQVASGSAVSTSSPVLVDDGGSPFVAVGDSRGRVRAYDLVTGTPVAGWSATGVGVGLRAPLSSDGQHVYVPVAQDGIARYPQYKKFAADGSLVWNSNPSTVLPASNTYGFLLSGLSLAPVSGGWRGVGGSSGQWFYGVDGASGAAKWSFLNADSTMATPAIADLYGTGSPQVITSNDASAEFAGDRNGGILRVLTLDGRQICTATQFVDGSTYAASGYNNSSPAVAEIGGRPLIAFGSTGPVQYGSGGNQVVAYDADCSLRWASPKLGGQAAPSPVFADVRGRGTPDVVQLVAVSSGGSVYPRVYVLDSSTGAVVSDTGSSLASYGGALAYPSSISITTADVNDDGAQDLFVPAWQGRFLVLDGRTLAVMGTINTNLVIQNTPIVTATADGVRITLAGYNGLGAQVSSYTATGAVLGSLGWREFGNGPQLTGLQGTLAGPYDQLLEGQTLGPGQSIRRGASRAVMQNDGNFVLYGPGGVPRWSTRTAVPGSRLTIGTDGSLSVRSGGGTLLWSEPATNSGVERLALGADGVLRVVSELWATTRRLNTRRVIWTSSTGPTPWDRIGRGESLAGGQFLVSPDGSSRAQMQTDGNLVVTRASRVMWQSGTRDATGRASTALNLDGNLVVYDNRGWPLLNVGIGGRGARSLVLGNDGILRAVTAGGGVVWSSVPPPPPRPVK